MPATEDGTMVDAQISQPVFQTFESDNKNLGAGLCILRDLGDGIYEIVNLKTVDHSSLTSKELGLTLKNDDTRLAALSVGKEEWQLAQFKCEQAVKSASASIFRFQDLPLELRMKVYDHMVSTNPLRKVNINSPYTKTGLFSLMQSCKQLYEEAKPFFYQNNFKMVAHSSLKAVPSFQEYVKNVSIQWPTHSGEQDSVVLRFLATCKSLETLDIQISRIGSMATRPKLYQGVIGIKKFNKCSNFDHLVRIRGLKRVIVDGSDQYPRNDDFATDEEVKTFEVFLNGVLTQPRDLPLIPEATAAKKTKKGKKRTHEESKSS